MCAVRVIGRFHAKLAEFAEEGEKAEVVVLCVTLRSLREIFFHRQMKFYLLYKSAPVSTE